MPSVSAKQAKLMRIAAHTEGGYRGVPQSVGKEFYSADQAKKGKSRMKESKTKPKFQDRHTYNRKKGK